MDKPTVTTRRATSVLMYLTFPLLACFAVFTSLGAQNEPEDPRLQYQLATEMYDDARFHEAIVAYDAAMSGADADLVMRARKGKVRAALRIAEFSLAHREAEMLGADETADTEAQTLYGDALWATGRFDEADEAYGAALEDAPGSSRARFGLARSLATRSRLDEALDEALAAATAAPDDPEVHALVGLIYERLNRFDEAADAFERYTDLVPTRDRSGMAEPFDAKVRLLRSFRGRVPLEIEPASAGRVHRLPFRLVNRKIVLQGRVNGRGVDFVLDTGAERTGISADTARRAGVSAVSSTLTAGVGPASFRRLDLGRADRLEVGSLRMRNVPVSIRNVGRGTLPRWQAETFSPLALGLSVMVDYQSREVVLAETLPDTDADIRLPLRMNRLPMVRGLINSTHPAYFIVDTGGELISISAETATALSMPPPPRRIPLRVFGMSGMDTDAFLLPGIDLDFDEIEYRQVGLAVLNLRAPSVLLGFQLGGIVGHTFLGGYRVSIDMERSELRLARF